MSGLILPTIISALLVYVLGALWYSPILFGKPWMAAQNLNPDDLSMSGKDFALTALTWLIAAIMFSALVAMTGYDGFTSFVCIAVVVFLGFTLTPLVMANIYEGTSNTVTLLSMGYHLTGFLIMAVVHTFL